jgi:AI-2E family transporter
MADEFRQFADERVSEVTARVALIERSILVLIFVGLLVGVLVIVKPFTTALLFGATFATAAWPARQGLVRCGLRRGLAAALLLLLSLVLVVLPMLVVAPYLADQLSQGIQHIQSYFAATPEQPAWIKGVPLVGRRLAAAWDRVVQVQGSGLVALRARSCGLRCIYDRLGDAREHDRQFDQAMAHCFRHGDADVADHSRRLRRFYRVRFLGPFHRADPHRHHVYFAAGVASRRLKPSRRRGYKARGITV